MGDFKLPNQLNWPHSSGPLNDVRHFGFANSQLAEGLSTNTFGIVGNQEHPHAKFWPYFGKNPNALVKPADYDYSREIYNLPEAYIGQNAFIAQVLMTQISKRDQYPIREMFPWQQWDGGQVIQWNRWIYDDHMLSRTPEQSVSRLVTSQKDAKSETITRYGIAFMAEHGFMRTQLGREMYAANLQQIVNATVETLCLGAFEALLYVDFGRWKNSAITQLTSRAVLDDIVGKEVRNFAITQVTPHGTRLAIDDVIKTFTKRNGKPPTYMVFGEGVLKQMQERPENWIYALAGPSGGSENLKQRQQGITLRESRTIRSDGDSGNVNPFEIQTVIGSFARLDMSKLGNCPPEEFRTHMLDRRIHVYPLNDYFVLSNKRMVMLSGAFVSNGDSGRPGAVGGAHFGAKAALGAPKSQKSRWFLSDAIGQFFFAGYENWAQYMKDKGVLNPWIRSFQARDPDVQAGFLADVIGGEADWSSGGVSDETEKLAKQGRSIFGTNAVWQRFLHEASNQAGEAAGGSSEVKRNEQPSLLSSLVVPMLPKTIARAFASAPANEEAKAISVRDQLMADFNDGGPSVKKMALIAARFLSKQRWNGRDDEPAREVVRSRAHKGLLQRWKDRAASQGEVKDDFTNSDTRLRMGLILTDYLKDFGQMGIRPGAGRSMPIYGAGQTVIRVDTESSDSKYVLDFPGWESKGPYTYTQQVATLLQASVLPSSDNSRGVNALIRIFSENTEQVRLPNLSSVYPSEDTIHAYVSNMRALCRDVKATSAAIVTRFNELQSQITVYCSDGTEKLEQFPLIEPDSEGDTQLSMLSGRLMNSERQRRRTGGSEVKDPPVLHPQVAESVSRMMYIAPDAVKALYSKHIGGAFRDTNEFATTMNAIYDAYVEYRKQTKKDPHEAELGLTMLLNEMYYQKLLGDSAKKIKEAAMIKDQRTILTSTAQLYLLGRVLGEKRLEMLQDLNPGAYQDFLRQNAQSGNQPAMNVGEALNYDNAQEDKAVNAKSNRERTGMTYSQCVRMLEGIPIHNADIVPFSLENDLWPLVYAYVWALAKTYMTTPLAALRAYGEAGLTLHGNHMFELGDDPAIGVHYGHFTLYAKTIVKDENLIEHRYHVHVHRCVGGNDATFWDPNNSHHLQAWRQRQALCSRIVTLVAPDEVITDRMLDATGKLHMDVQDSGVSVPEQQGIWANFWGIRHAAKAIVQAPYKEPGMRYNTLCFEEHQLCGKYEGKDKFNPTGEVVLNAGHFGQNYGYPGSSDIYSGKALYLERPNFSPLSSRALMVA